MHENVSSCVQIVWGLRSTPECFTCLKKGLDLRWSTMNSFQLPHMRTSISPDPRLVYTPLNMSICMRTFPHACTSCEGSVSTPECFTCLKKRLDLRWSTMNFSQLPHMRTSISPDPRPFYIPVNMSMWMRTFPDGYRSCECSVSTPGCFTCLKKRSTFADLPWISPNFHTSAQVYHLILDHSTSHWTCLYSCEHFLMREDRVRAR